MLKKGGWTERILDKIGLLLEKLTEQKSEPVFKIFSAIVFWFIPMVTPVIYSLIIQDYVDNKAEKEGWSERAITASKFIIFVGMLILQFTTYLLLIDLFV